MKKNCICEKMMLFVLTIIACLSTIGAAGNTAPSSQEEQRKGKPINISLKKTVKTKIL